MDAGRALVVEAATMLGEEGSEGKTTIQSISIEARPHQVHQLLHVEREECPKITIQR
jgi:hypothetical protein